MVKCSNGNTDCRSFKIAGSGIGFKGGRYVAPSRTVAARRAGSKIFQKINNDSNYTKFNKKMSVKFILVETSRGMPKKTVAYEVTKEKLTKPTEFKKGGQTIIVKFKYIVTRLSDQEDPEICKM